MPNDMQVILAAKHELPAISAVIAEAMLTNPINMAVFKGSDQRIQQKQRAMFKSVLSLPQCNVYVARMNGQIAGAMNMIQSPACRFSMTQKLTMIPGLLMNMGAALPRVLHWTGNWEKHDPHEPHWHLGPLAVAPSLQGKGIGSTLLKFFCNYVDARKEAAYLETDKLENVRLYEKFGFVVREEDIIYGVKNWFMFRDAVS